MSVLIKDMEIPTSCTMCWLNTFCGVWNTEQVKHKGFNERLENCPLTEMIQCKDCIHHHGYYCDRLYGFQDAFTLQDEDYCSRAERKPPQVNPEMVKALKDRIEKQRGEDA